MSDRPPGTRTPWYPGKTAPVRSGAYERRIFGDVVLSHFDGKRWHIASDTVADAKGKPLSGYQPTGKGSTSFIWRGLAAKP